MTKMPFLVCIFSGTFLCFYGYNCTLRNLVGNKWNFPKNNKKIKNKS